MWYQLHIEICQREEVEQLSDALEQTGALSITYTDKYDNPVLEPEPGTTPLWPFVIVQALYDERPLAEKAQQTLAGVYPHLQFSLTELQDENWERVWMDNFKPMRFGNRLWICPTWLEPPEPDAVNLMLDPGLAFGTGTHATTSLCLTWLDGAKLNGCSVIDYGCGSGILALAALQLGASHVHAVDIDEQALTATANNARTNNIPINQLAMSLPDSLTTPVDLVIANILLAPLMQLKDRFKALIKEDGTLVVSGLLASQADELILAYQADFIHQASHYLDDWALVVFNRRQRQGAVP